jgi:hypothetical protein
MRCAAPRLYSLVALALLAHPACSDEPTPRPDGPVVTDDAGADGAADGAATDSAPQPDGPVTDAAGDAAGDGPAADLGPTPDGPPPYQPPCGKTAKTKVIGNWDLVPQQTFSGTFQVGVVAFHEYGTDVAFSVNGKALATVKHPTLNPRTGVYEHWVALNASDYQDGAITLGATILPDCAGHISRKLKDVVLYANAGGSLTNSKTAHVDCQKGSDSAGKGTQAAPYATVEKGLVSVGTAGTVYLAAGTCYKLTKLYPSGNFKRWTTVQPAPGVTRSQVQIMASGSGATGRFGEDMVRWKQVQIYKDVAPGHSTVFYLESNHSIWFDGAELFDKKGRLSGGTIMGGNSPHHVYATNAVVRDVMNMTGMCGFCRGLQVSNIGSDIFRAHSNLLSVNMTIKTIDKGSTSAHPDFFQLYAPGGTVENIVIYNTHVTDMLAQGIFGSTGNLRDAAFVNLLLEKDPASSYLMSQVGGSWDHVLLWHVTTVDSSFNFTSTSGLKNFWIQNNVWHTLNAGATTSLTSSTISHNLFRSLVWNQPKPMGTSAIQGDPKFVDEKTDDYRLSKASPARLKGIPLPDVPVDIKGKPYHLTTPNLGAFAD